MEINQSKIFCNVHVFKKHKSIFDIKSDDKVLELNYIKFFNILLKKPSKQVIRQLVDFFISHKYLKNEIFRKVLYECKLHKYPDIINEILFNITKYKNIYDILNIIYILLELGADINQKIDNNNNTLLHKASYEGNKHICLQLIKHGSNINLLNSNNETPLNIFGNILDRSLNQFTNSCKLECCSLFTKEANWIRRRNYILLIQSAKKLFMTYEGHKPFSYKFIMCDDVIRYIALFL